MGVSLKGVLREIVDQYVRECKHKTFSGLEMFGTRYSISSISSVFVKRVTTNTADNFLSLSCARLANKE